ncbi:hypothetical protein [Chitinibacter tainanensis]|uniref:hypothetical protein n=1 Tax=Chitinibacter tainanensis TaxID=230667 RepID=UPI002355682F|nr:hypothetical protein [Chitinibacter tainanensis]
MFAVVPEAAQQELLNWHLPACQRISLKPESGISLKLSVTIGSGGCRGKNAGFAGALAVKSGLRALVEVCFAVAQLGVC